jgi:rhodanese-related sulfurtransferase
MQYVTIKNLQQQYGDLAKKANLTFVDVRNPEEYQHEHIQGSINMPIDGFSKEKLAAYQNNTLVFLCRSGNRTKINEHIFEAIQCTNKVCLEGGLMAWKNAKLPVISNSVAPIDVMRQVQIIVSVMILLGLVLNFVVSSYFLILPLFAGLGLLTAGLTGFCGMANVLKFMPWNKPKN